jgi:hypothetical protein
VLLSFDDSLATSFAGADAVLRQLRWTGVMFVDTGSVQDGHPGYASWTRIAGAQRSGRWEMQLHAGRGHHNIVYDPAGTNGPFYATASSTTRTSATGNAGWSRTSTGATASS